MPRKRWLTRLSIADIPVIDPKDRHTVRDHDLVRAVLRDFEELANLPAEIREQLVADLVIAVWTWRAGIKAGKRGLSDMKEARHIFISDVGRALRRAGLPVKRWRRTYQGDRPDRDAPESLFFRLVRALGDSFGRSLPKDLKLAGQKASKIKYGEMSPGMAVVQAAELERQRQQRLRRVWGDHLVDPPQTCEEVASAYLGFPFGAPDSANRAVRPNATQYAE
jgi:hypothetical protein